MSAHSLLANDKQLGRICRNIREYPSLMISKSLTPFYPMSLGSLTAWVFTAFEHGYCFHNVTTYAQPMPSLNIGLSLTYADV
jgi:hypothetical protein